MPRCSALDRSQCVHQFIYVCVCDPGSRFRCLGTVTAKPAITRTTDSKRKRQEQLKRNRKAAAQHANIAAVATPAEAPPAQVRRSARQAAANDDTDTVMDGACPHEHSKYTQIIMLHVYK